MSSWLEGMLGCMVGAQSPKLDSCCWLNALDYLMLL